MKIIAGGLLSFATIFGNMALAEQVPGSNILVGNWVGAAYTFDQTGHFSHCAISASYVSGLNLIFSINRDATVTVGVSGLVNIREGQQFPVLLQVDRMAPFFGNANAISSDMALLHFSDFPAAMNAFQRGHQMRIDALGRSSFFSLAGTFRTLEATRECALTYYNYRMPQQLPNAGTTDRTSMFQLSTLVIASLGITDFRYFSEAELADLGWQNTVAWDAPRSGVSGISIIAPRNPNQNSLRDSESYARKLVMV